MPPTKITFDYKQLKEFIKQIPLAFESDHDEVSSQIETVLNGQNIEIVSTPFLFHKHEIGNDAAEEAYKKRTRIIATITGIIERDKRKGICPYCEQNITVGQLCSMDRTGHEYHADCLDKKQKEEKK